MAKEDNLKKNLTTEEAREQGRRGGIASGVARRRKRALREKLNALLYDTCKNEEVKTQIQQMGIIVEDNLDVVITALYSKAIQGDVQAISKLLEWSKLIDEPHLNISGNLSLSDDKIADVMNRVEKAKKKKM